MDKKGQYTVKANYGHFEGDLSGSILASFIWNNCVPPKVSVFTWKVWWGKVLTMDQLNKRGFELASRCPLYKEDEENIDHLLLHFPLVWGFWAALISLQGMEWVCSFLVKDLMVGWTTFPIRKKAKNLWQAALSSLCWAICNERNMVVFDNVIFSQEMLKNSFITSLTSWTGLIYEGEYSIVNLLMCVL